MTIRWPFPEDQLDAVIRSTLESAGRDSNVAEIHARAKEGAATLDALARRRRFARWSIAAGIGAAGALAPFLWSQQASALSLVQSVAEELNKDVDRCYDVDLSSPRELLILRMMGPVRIWTRGDRFRVLMDHDGTEFVWGTDERRRLWFACSPDLGLLFEAHEIPAQSANVLKHLYLDTRQLTGQLLNDCDLEWHQGKRPAGGKATVIATARRGKSIINYERATLDIDVRSKTIRGLELSRTINGRESIRCRLTFVEAAPQPDESYHLQTYLAEGATILDRRRAKERLMEFRRLLLMK